MILGILLWAWPRRQFKGQLFAAYFILEGVGRFVIETWRGDLARGTWWNVEGLSTGRLTALLFILLVSAFGSTAGTVFEKILHDTPHVLDCS